MMSSAAKKAALVAALLAGVAVAAVLVLGLVVAPKMAKDEVESQFERVERRTGLDVSFGALDTNLSGGVSISDIVVTDAQGKKVARVERASASADIFRALLGEKVVSDLEASGVVVTLHRDATGSFTLLDQLRDSRPDDDSDGSDEPDSAPGAGILRYFGGEFPDVDVANVTIVVDSHAEAPPFPIVKLMVETATIDGGEVASITSEATIESTESKSWSIPGAVEFSAEIDTRFVPRALDLEFDRPAEIGGFPPYPFLRVGLAGMSIESDLVTTVRGVRLGFEHEAEPFLEIGSVRADLDKWTLDPRKISIAELVVTEPRLELTYDELGASAVSELDHLIRGPTGRHVATNAKRLATEIAEARTPVEEPTQPQDAVGDNDAPAQKEDDKDHFAPPEDSDLVSKVIDRAPDRLTIEGAIVEVTDHRDLPVARPARELRLSDASFQVTHRPDEKTFQTAGAFVASADGESRGKGEGKLDWRYGDRTIDAALDLDALDLSWAAQLLGPRVARHVRGGTLRAKLVVTPSEGRSVEVDGTASVESLVFDWRKLAEEPLRDVTASYGFTAIYDPDGKTPESELLDIPLFKEDVEPPSGAKKGSVVFTRGAAQFNGVKAEVKPAVYGTAALPSSLPARIDLAVDMPKTPVMDLFNAVPKAILGPLQGTEMRGTFGWEFKAEIPLHRAGDMEWKTVPALESFELVAIPDEVDVRKLITGMELTITDEISDEMTFTRTVKIPPMKPIPASWLLENAERELEQIDEVRRRREWPEVPEFPRQLGLAPTFVSSPDYWLSQHAEAKSAPAPWSEGDVIEKVEEPPENWPYGPYGPYVYVPLHHISKWMTRAILTTEDNSFFKHDGLNFFALKESVEDNIEAGGFRRGASTISMQLIKNVFLDRQKLIARKLREVFLVWLMEKIIDVPKPRILELYFNVIEFGPGIFGIHDASVHYFGKRPSELTLGEVAWLVSIIPNPKKYHFYWERGEITPNWFRRMSRYINVMHNRERASLEEKDAALEAAPEFYKPEKEDPVLREKESIFGTDILDNWFGGSDDEPNDDLSPTPRPQPEAGSPGDRPSLNDTPPPSR